MRDPFRWGLGVGAGCLLMSAGLAAAAGQVPSYIDAAVGSPARPPTDTARDEDRKPAATIAYAGLKPGDKVLELEPGRGFYTRVLSKVVGPKGKVYALSLRPPAGPNAPAPARGSPVDAVYHLSLAKEFDNVTALYSATMGAAGNIGLPEPVDVIWTSDNYHDFHDKSFGPLDIGAINASIFRNLKPGGVYIVIDHATAAGAGTSQTETLHRIDPEAVKQEVLAAGFEFDGRGDMLAHSSDDHTKPVFQLQGHEDDFVLRFRKPRAAKTVARTPDSEMSAYFGNTLSMRLSEQQTLSIFYHADHTYEEFGPSGASYGIWYLSADGQNCMLNQSASGADVGTTHCDALEFPASKHPKASEADSGASPIMLLKGYVYPAAAAASAGPPPG